MGGPRLKELFNIKGKEIKELRESGESYQSIANTIGCSVTAIRNYCIVNDIQGNVRDKIIGQTFEKSQLKVLERDSNPSFQSHETGYKCECILCGSVQTYRKSNILNGPGCHECTGIHGGRGYREWEVGQKFGMIEILDKGDKNGYVLGKCECGTIRNFALQHLKGNGGHSRTISCGCSQKSSGELKIETILIENNINFKTQYRICEFSPYAPFDFAIFDDNYNLIKLIEFDGKQHFEAIDAWGGEEQLKIQQERDARKDEWCRKNNISLLRIPYWEYDNIDIGYLI